MRYFDLPPLWTLAFALLAWLQERALPLPKPEWAPAAGLALFAAAVALMLLSAAWMLAKRTTVDPHGRPSALVTSGPFALSRNPIYLADLAALTGWIVHIGAWPSLVLVPLLHAILTRRFILPEEARLETAFETGWRAYSARVRRWI